MVVIDQPIGSRRRRSAGSERTSAVGDTVLEAGTVLTPGHLGVLANQGLDRGRASTPDPGSGSSRPGDELVSGPGPLAPGQIRDANRHTLLALVRREGWDAVDLGIVGDDEDDLGRRAGRCRRPAATPSSPAAG